MNPLTDKLSSVQVGDRTVNIVIPGGLNKSSKNWRLTREAYENYAPHLRLGIENFERGEETSFNVPSGVSPNTFAARFRDAKQALLLYGYDPLLQQRLIALGNVAVSMDPDGKHVWFRARHQPGREIKATVDQVKRPLAPVENITDMPDETELTAMCLLINKGRLLGPVFFRGAIDPSLQSRLEESYDVGFAFDDTTNTTTLI